MKLIVWSKRIIEGTNVDWLKGHIEVIQSEDSTGTIFNIVARDPPDLVIELDDILTLSN